MRPVFGVSVQRPVGRTFGRTRHRWEGNVTVALTITGWNGMDWIHLIGDSDKWQALVNAVMDFRVS